MLFSSITFLFYFLPGFLLAYAATGRANTVLLAASLLFYAWGDPLHLPLLLACILLNWGAGLLLHRRHALALGIAGNLALLFWFKYANFAAAQLAALAGLLGLPAPPAPDVGLPLGISFFTFQGISYLIDIHRGTVAPQRSLLKFATYKAMFPPLIAGPIVRYADVASRLGTRRVGWDDLEAGLMQFALGLGQKVLIANTVAAPVDRIFALPAAELGPGLAWVGALGYALQIYFDFAGYSNMAIGLGRVLGFTFPPNFDMPYVSRSVGEFWRRWHMSLSSWFRDYLYIPLGGNRGGPWRTARNLLLVFLLCGLWHGAAWTFVIWGLWHGAFLAAERGAFGRAIRRLPGRLQHLYLLLVVILGWVPFRAPDLAAALMHLQAMAGLGAHPATAAVSLDAASLAAFAAGAVLAVWRPRIEALPALARATCLGLTVLSTASLAAGTYNPFIYFRF